jgi:hypothetical protein
MDEPIEGGADMAKAWKRAAVAALGALVIGGGINAAMAAGRDDPRPTTSVQKVADDRGREQEARGRVAEGENEVRGRENELRGRENEPGEDISGPCDEAEHANDPRCAGGATEDSAGRGGQDDGPNHDANDDNSGPSDHSGPGGGDDSGHGGESGHGGSDD